MDLSRLTAEVLWPNALGVIPVAILVAALCRLFSTRSGKGGATRHALWATLLVCFLLPPVLPRLKIPSSPAVSEARDGGGTEAVIAPVPAGALAASQGAEQTRLAPRSPRGAHQKKEGVLTGDRPLAARHPSGDQWIQRPAAPRPPSARTRPTSSPDAVAPPALALPALVAMETSATPVSTHAGGPRLDDPAPDRSLRVDAAAFEAPAAKAAPPSPFRLERVPARRDLSPGAAVKPLVILVAGVAESTAKTALAAATPDLDAWRAWLGKLAPVREAVATVPPVPASVWLAGAALVMAVAGLRIAAFQHVLRGGRVPRREVQREVEEAARVLGLRRLPRTIMVSGRVSPMIWCGRVCTLILPQGLWNELDGAGRRAVVLHELAHLRRRDHWVRWVELAASVLYWWHPLVWWVRHRLREEADLCCDAWVTALLPSHRRAYAQALLSTRVYLSDPSRGGTLGTPPVGLGVTTATARRFARRLTMVMKGRNRPGLSTFGAVLSISVIGAAMVATPLWACPPDEVAKQQAKEKGKLAKARYKAKGAQDEAAVEAERAAQIAETEARRAAEIGEREARRAAEIADRETQRARAIAEREAARAEREAQRAAMEAERAYAAAAATTPQAPRPAKAPKPPKPPKAPKPPVATAAPVPPAPPSPPSPPDEATTYEQYLRGQPTTPAPSPRARGMAPAARGRPGQPAPGGERIEQLENRLDRLEQQIERLQRLLERRSGMAVPRNSAPAGLLGLQDAGGEPVARVYHLPDGKLEALTSLMSRGDVPVLVSRVDDGLQVQATPGQHEAMGAFLALINPESAEEVAVVLEPSPVIADPTFDISIPDIDVSVEPLQIEIPAELPDVDVNLDVQPLIAQAMTLDEMAARVSEQSAEQTERLLERLTERLSVLRDRAAELTEKVSEMQSQADELKSEAGDLESGAQEMEAGDKARELARASDLLAKAEAILATASGLSERADNTHAGMHTLRDAVHQLADTLCHRICGEGCTHCSDSCPKCNGSLDLDDEDDDSPAAEEDEHDGDCPKASSDCDKSPSAGREESEEESPII